MNNNIYSSVTYLKEHGNFQSKTSPEAFFGANSIPNEQISKLAYSIETQAALLAICLYTCGEAEHLPFIHKDPDQDPSCPYLQLTETVRVYLTIDAETLEIYVDLYEETHYI